MKIILFRLPIYLCCLVVDLIAWSIVLFARVVFGGKLRVVDGILLLFTEKKMPIISGLTLGHAIIIEYSAKDNDFLIRHELFHVRQLEAAAVTGAVLAIFFAFMGMRWSLIVFAFLPWIHYYASSLAAWLRGGKIYRDNNLELGARGVDDHPEGV